MMEEVLELLAADSPIQDEPALSDASMTASCVTDNSNCTSEIRLTSLKNDDHFKKYGERDGMQRSADADSANDMLNSKKIDVPGASTSPFCGHSRKDLAREGTRHQYEPEETTDVTQRGSKYVSSLFPSTFLICYGVI
ncbi:hypothetical protein CCR75_004078 [Bremia lactucae]|uniref:Uncharacterized protein n=1 Tax=Bremia lactucae TaxID=4779 RepID=A0A976IKM0_BRELC|nr:hypothetical protein CCR75_004078 [Bremia lactucae]